MHALRGDWNYLTVQLARTSDDEAGDPDFYGVFTGGQSGQVYHCQDHVSMQSDASCFSPRMGAHGSCDSKHWYEVYISC